MMINMTSLFEKPFDYDEMVNDLKISFEQLVEGILEESAQEIKERMQEILEEKAQEIEEKVLVNTIQIIRDFGIADNQIRTKLLEKYSAQQIDEAFAKADSGE